MSANCAATACPIALRSCVVGANFGPLESTAAEA